MKFDSYWLQVIKKIIVLFSGFFIIYLGLKISLFYVPFLVAFLISQLMEPVIKYLMKKCKMRRKISAILILTVVLSIIVGIVVLAVVSLISEATNLLNNINYYIDKIYSVSQNYISKFNFEKIQLSNELNIILSDSTGNFINTVSVWIKNLLMEIVNIVTSLPKIGLCIGITIIALYFMCTDKIYMLDQIEHHIPEKWVKKIMKHTQSLIKKLGCYLRAQFILIFISFVISVIGLYFFSIVGMKVTYPLIAAIGIAIVDALPIFGSGTVMIPWAVISACNGDIVLGVSLLTLWILMSIIRQIIEPKIVSKEIGIHPIFTLIAMYTGFKFAGFLGIYIGPIILIILKEIYGNKLDKGFVKSLFE